MRKSLLTFPVAAVALFASADFASACGVCMGRTDGSQIGGALNGAIFVMLGFLGLMLACVTGLSFTIWRRSQNPSQSPLELAEMIGSQPASK
jgi:hypothetical protein